MRLHKKANQASGGTAKRRLPDTYICIAPEESLLVFDYLRGRRRDIDEKLVALHLNLCDRCQDTADSLKVIDDEIEIRLASLALVS